MTFIELSINSVAAYIADLMVLFSILKASNVVSL